MYVLIDNYDSFSYTLASYLVELGAQLSIVRNDEVDLEELERLEEAGELEGIVISPGPGAPEESGRSFQVLSWAAERVPVLGVCLGHQVLATLFGSKVVRGACPMHGQVSTIATSGKGLFAGLPRSFEVTRYHSLVVDEKSLPPELVVDARSTDGAVMALRHRSLPLFGLQFHPEALCTQHGHDLLRAFLSLAPARSREVLNTPSFECATHPRSRSLAGGARMTTVVTLEASASLADIFALVCDEPHAAFLDSARRDEQGRYSIVGLHPSLVLEDREGQLLVDGTPSEGSFLERLRSELERRREPNETDLPIVAGCIGYLSYDFGRALERVETAHPRTSEMPDAQMCFYELLLIEDHERGELSAAVHVDDPERECVLLNEARDLCRRATPLAAPERYGGGLRFGANFSQADYLQALEDLLEHMAAGDTYVANLTQTFTAPVDVATHSYDIYRYLRNYNPAPFAAYLNAGCAQVLCASMERFVQLRADEVVTRPIKGTRPRGTTPEQDRALRAELEASDKDKSELLMVVDLERNDLSKVCVPGTVKVPALFQTESYATVFHLVATVTGTLAADKNAVDLIEATFPGGSITGAPKRRTMQIIDELEHGRRGLYTGSIGYLSLDGDADLNIVIRTAVREGTRCTVGAGGGITYESDVDFEYEETRTKARAVLEAIASTSRERGDEHDA